ncbi:MAG: hypothetical protein ACXWEY_12435 [Bacteroidia bacterium]
MKSPYIESAKNAFIKLNGWKVEKLESYRDAKQPYNIKTLQLSNFFPYIVSAKNALAALVMLSSVAVYAQDDKKTLGDETVIIVRDYKPKLSDAVKIDVLPANENVETKKPEIAYKTPAFLFNTPPYKAQLKAPSLGKPPVDELHHNYAKLMFGNYADINGEYIFNTLRNRNSLFTLHGKHHSGNGPVDNSRFSENMIDVFGKRIFSGHSITGNLGYKRNANRFYGQLPLDSVPDANPDSLKQKFNDIYFSTKLARVNADTGKFQYGADLGVYNFNDLYKTGETGFNIGVNGVEPFRGSRIHADASYQYWKYKTDTSIDRGLFKLGAGYKFIYNGFRADVGFKTASDESFHFFPNANIEADIIQKYLTLYGGITGGTEANTFRQFAYENPFINSDITLKNTTEKLNLFGGAKGSFSSTSTFGIGLAYKNYENMPFFLNDSTDLRRFNVLYDALTNVFNIHAEAGLAVMENFSLGAALNYNTYNLSTMAKAYHRPDLDAVITGKYTVANKIAFGADLFFAGKRYGATWLQDSTTKTYKLTEYSLGNIIDLNANASYAFGGSVKGLKAHLELKNILGTKYQLWNFYPSRGFQITGGVSYSFL